MWTGALIQAAFCFLIVLSVAGFVVCAAPLLWDAWLSSADSATLELWCRLARNATPVFWPILMISCTIVVLFDGLKRAGWQRLFHACLGSAFMIALVVGWPLAQWQRYHFEELANILAAQQRSTK
jgi:hypothetical protein